MNLPAMYRVLIADDQPYCLQALQLALKGRPGITLCGEARDGRQLLELTDILQPDVIVTDISMPHMNGIEATRLIKERYPQLKILALTQYKDEGLIIEMTRAGADGYLVKDAESRTLEAAITTVMNGSPFFCKNAMHMLQQMMKQGVLKSSFKPLLPHFFAAHEKEILLLICRGLSSKQIAHTLGLAYNTVIKYRQNLMEKTGAENEVALAMFAVVYGICTPEHHPAERRL